MESLFQFSMVFLLFTSASCIEVVYLRGVPRLGSTSHWDYYFSCSTEGQILRWGVNGANSGGFVTGGMQQVIYTSENSFESIATLLSSQLLSQQQYTFYSILIVSLGSNSGLTVTCSNEFSNNGTTNEGNKSDIEYMDMFNFVHLQYLLKTWSIHENFLNTRIFVCGTNDMYLLWRVNGSLVSFTIIDEISQERGIMQLNETTLKQYSFVIAKEPYQIVSVLFVTGRSDIEVKCGINNNFLTFSNMATSKGTEVDSVDTTSEAAETKGTTLTDMAIVKESDSNKMIQKIVIPVVIFVSSLAIIGVIIAVAAAIFHKKKQKRVKQEPLPETDDVLKFSKQVKEPADKNSTLIQSGKSPASKPSSSKPDIDIEQQIQHLKKKEERSSRDDKSEGYSRLISIDVLAKKSETKLLQEFQHIERHELPKRATNISEVNTIYVDGQKQLEALVNPITREELWMMIYEKKVTTIVNFGDGKNVGNSVEDWPNDLMCKDHLKLAYYEIRKFEVHKKSHGKSSPDEIQHINYYNLLEWTSADHVPEYTTFMIQFINHIKFDYRNQPDRPTAMMVLSNIGSAPIGVFITLNAMLEQNPREISVFKFVLDLRLKGNPIVQKVEQYIFIHRALNEMIISPDKLEESQLRLESEKRDFENELKLLDSLTDKGSLNKSVIKMDLQHQETHISLKDDLPSSCIKATLVDGYRKKWAYIATQSPVGEVVNCFWSMIWQYHSQFIILLGPLQDQLEIFWPEYINASIKPYDRLSVTLRDERHLEDYVERKIAIENGNSIQEPLNVTFYHIEKWMCEGSILHLINSLECYRNTTNNQHVTVMCSDGFDSSGALITIHAMIERVQTESVVDFFQFVKLSRIQLPSLLTELKNYKFCYDTLLYYVDNKDNYPAISLNQKEEV